jgi:putative RecB family exonuclease
MSLPLPTSLSPSKVSTFTECALAFRFSAIDRLEEPPSPVTAKGTLVHRALERLFWHEPQGERTLGAALRHLEAARPEVLEDDEHREMELPDAEWAEFFADAEVLVRQYFELEDPNSVRMIGTELRLEANIGGLRLRGIIDRLELDDDGELVVTDYKTGRAPGEFNEQRRLMGIHFYAFLCEQALGRRPARIQLLHLREPVAITAVPSEQSIRALGTKTRAIWSAVERACLTESFRPKPSRLCDYCSFRAYCPAVGGDLSLVPAAVPDLVAAG